MNLYLYTVNKAASDYVAHQVMRPAGNVLGLQHVDLAHDAFQGGRPIDEVAAGHARLFEQGGNYFGAMRLGLLAGIAYQPQDRIVLHLRDPRDCLTSQYFSITRSHVVPDGPGKKLFLEKRRLACSQTIDEYCISNSPRLLTALCSYLSLFNRGHNLLVTRYEQMVSDFENWLTRLYGFLGVPVTDPSFTRILDDADFVVEKEDAARHKRRVTPGDFQEKLQPGTIVRLNEIFASVLEQFNYPLTPRAYRIWTRNGETRAGRS